MCAVLYEYNFFDIKFILIHAPFLILLFFVVKYIHTNELLTKRDRIRWITLVSIILGSMPLLSSVDLLYKYINYKTGNYLVISGPLLSTELVGGRKQKLIFQRKILRYSIYGVKCLKRKINLPIGEPIEVKYIKHGVDDCILSIKKL